MKAITEDYVSFEVAKLLKEKGFDSDEVGCLGGFYSESAYESGHGIITQNGQEVGIVTDDLTNAELEHDEYLRPTLQMAMKWLREVHNYIIMIDYDSYEKADEEGIITGYSFTVQKKENPTEYEYIHNWAYDTHEEAVDAALLWSLKNLI